MYKFKFKNDTAFHGEIDGLFLSATGDYKATKEQRDHPVFKTFEELGLISEVTPESNTREQTTEVKPEAKPEASTTTTKSTKKSA